MALVGRRLFPKRILSQVDTTTEAFSFKVVIRRRHVVPFTKMSCQVAPEVLSVYRANQAELILAERINSTKKGIRGAGLGLR